MVNSVSAVELPRLKHLLNINVHNTTTTTPPAGNNNSASGTTPSEGSISSAIPSNNNTSNRTTSGGLLSSSSEDDDNGDEEVDEYYLTYQDSFAHRTAEAEDKEEGKGMKTGRPRTSNISRRTAKQMNTGRLLICKAYLGKNANLQGTSNPLQ